MTGETRLLATDSLARWLRAPGFLMAIAVMLIPPALTAAWVGTHQDDIAVIGITMDPERPEIGDKVNFTVDIENLFSREVDAFDVTLRIGYTDESFGRSVFVDSHNSTQRVEGLGPGATTSLTFTWDTSIGLAGGTQLISTIGTLLVEAIVDAKDEIAEIEDENNRIHRQISVATPTLDEAPPPEVDRGEGEENATKTFLQARIDDVRIEPPASYRGDPDQYAPFADDRINITVQVRNFGPDALVNGSLALRMARFTYEATTVEGQTSIRPVEANPLRPDVQETKTFSVAANATANVTFEVRSPLQVSPYQALACLHTGNSVGYGVGAPWNGPCGAILQTAESDDPNDNLGQEIFRADRHVPYEPPAPQATAKDFYRNKVLVPIHFTLLVPFIALFYAGGVLQDDRAKGNLPYLLTRPVPRWSIPLTRFGSSFVVALLAVLIGVVVTFVLLLGTPRADSSYFWWPLFFSALVLLAYSALFTLVGVWSDRPYLVGLVYVLGFETLLAIGQSVLVNGRPLVQDWFITWFSLNHWVRKAMDAWQPDAPFAFVPAGEATPILVLVVVAVVGLIGSAVMMQTREFNE